MVKQPGQGTHIVDGSHEEEDDADDVNGKDGSQEDQHDDLLKEVRETRGNSLDRFFVFFWCVLKTTRGLSGPRKAQS